MSEKKSESQKIQTTRPETKETSRKKQAKINLFLSGG